MNTLNTLLPVARMFDALTCNLEPGQAAAAADVRHSPRADILEGEKEFRILMDLPGVKTGDVEISLEGQMLTVKAQRAAGVADGFQLRRHERPGPVSFYRSFSLGLAVDQSAITAGFENGVLQLTLPKSERGLPRRIEVQ